MKRVLLLSGVLAMTMLIAVPAMAQEDPCPDPNYPRWTPDGCQASDLPDVALPSSTESGLLAPAQYQYEPVATEAPPAPAPPEGATPLPVSGGMSPLLFVGAALAAVGLVGFGLLRR